MLSERTESGPSWAVRGSRTREGCLASAEHPERAIQVWMYPAAKAGWEVSRIDDASVDLDAGDRGRCHLKIECCSFIRRTANGTARAPESTAKSSHSVATCGESATWRAVSCNCGFDTAGSGKA